MGLGISMRSLNEKDREKKPVQVSANLEVFIYGHLAPNKIGH